MKEGLSALCSHHSYPMAPPCPALSNDIAFTLHAGMQLASCVSLQLQAAAQRARQHGSACCMRKLLQTLAIAMLPSRKVQVKPQAIHHAHTSCICPPVPVPKLGASLQYELHVRACVRSSSLARSLPSIYIHCSHWHACMHETTITE